MRRQVRIVGIKLDFSVRLRKSEQHDSVVDGDAGEPEEMHDGRHALAHALRNCPAICSWCHAGIMNTMRQWLRTK